jgi:CRP-like cAMP-binding protein
VRFARNLLRLSEASSAVRMTQEELGRMVGLSRSAFRRCFADLIDQGIVELQYGSIRIRDRRALQREAARVED